MRDDDHHEEIFLPEEIAEALISAAAEVREHESWLPRRQGIMVRLVPRALRILCAATLNIPEGAFKRKMIRQNVLRLLAYSEAEIRLGAVFELAANNPRSLHDLICEKIDAEYEPYRYNLIVTLGVFARHGLVGSVLKPQRMSHAQQALKRARHLRAQLSEEEAQ